eukprot:TRINITY_DN35833_c0_g1_i1.p1 TRINITY_DN35833_c0_g1~~TRINITY_DN35833_c0_g1_i1.p1  ORF type:complete len:423 (+),score=81.03 TRINITY_DN35833_c0_g1_i1:71-1339(+)
MPGRFRAPLTTLIHVALSWPGVAGTILLPLDRKPMASSSSESSTSKLQFVGKIQMGEPNTQEMEVLFETGSGSVILDSIRCTSPACLKHHRYAPSKAVGLNQRGVEGRSQGASLEVDEGDYTGEIHGGMMRDKVCLSNTCFDMGMLLADNMTGNFFEEAPVDGIVGLSLDGLAISKPFHFMSQFGLSTAGLPAQFAMFLPRSEEKGEIAFGGYNPAYAGSPLNWVPVQAPEDGFWQIHLAAVLIGSEELDFCKGGCRAIIESSLPYIQVPEEVLASMTAKLAVSAPKGWFSDQENCDSTQGKDLVFMLDNGMNLTLSATDYTTLEGKKCTPQLHPWKPDERKITGVRKEGSKMVKEGGVNFNSLVFGQPILQKYYTVFDEQNKKVGFSLAKAPLPTPQPEEIIALMQGSMQKTRPASSPEEL